MEFPRITQAFRKGSNVPPLRYRTLPFVWESLPKDQETAFFDQIIKWQGTKYGRGKPVPKVRASCITFPVSVLDTLYKVTDPLPLLPLRFEQYKFKENARLIRSILSRYPCERVRSCDFKVSAGDLILCTDDKGRNGHLMMVGLNNYIWHCFEGAGVVFSGPSFNDRTQSCLVRYRMLRKEKWCLPK